MEKILIRLMLFWGITILVASAPRCADAFELTELSIQYQRFHPSGRFPEMPEHQAKEGVGFNLNTDLVCLEWRGRPCLIWRNTVHALTDPGQYRLVGWKFFLGARIHWFEVGYHHWSQHLLEAVHPEVKFPVQDALSVKIHLLAPKL